MVRPATEPFSASGGLKLLLGNLGRSVIKVSAVKPQHRVVRAPARVFHDQAELLAEFAAGGLRHQGADVANPAPGTWVIRAETVGHRTP